MHQSPLGFIVLMKITVAAILELGAWFGALYSGVLSERYSRKYTILGNVVVFCVGVIIQCTAGAHNGGPSNIMGGRFITGMGVGRYGI